MTTGSVLAQFTITLSQAVSEQVAVEWHTADGTALAGVDYAAAKGTVLFAPGQTAKTVEILVYGRAVGSDDRSFFVEMLPPVNAILGASIGECIIHVDTTGSPPVTQIIVPSGPQGVPGEPGPEGPPGPKGDTPTAADIADDEFAAAGTASLSHQDLTTIAETARRVAYVADAKIATVVLADGDNLIAQSDLTGDAVDFSSIGFYPRIMRGTAILSPVWSVQPDGRLLIKNAVAGDVLYACQYDILSVQAIDLLPRESLRRAYKEAGLNLRPKPESFERGGELTSASDVLLHERSGKAYAGAGPFPQDVAEGTDPESVGSGFVSKADFLLKTNLASPTGAEQVGTTIRGSVAAYLSALDRLTSRYASLQAAADAKKSIAVDTYYSLTAAVNVSDILDISAVDDPVVSVQANKIAFNISGVAKGVMRGLEFVGAATPTDTASSMAVNTQTAMSVNYVTYKDIVASGLTVGLSLTKGRGNKVIGGKFGGMVYSPATLGSAGGYGILLQGERDVEIAGTHFIATATDRHPIYTSRVSTDPVGTGNCENVNIHDVVVDWLATNGTGDESKKPFPARSPRNWKLRDSTILGGAGGVFVTTENGSARDIFVINNYMRDMESRNSQFCAPISIGQVGTGYGVSGVIISGNKTRIARGSGQPAARDVGGLFIGVSQMRITDHTSTVDSGVMFSFTDCTDVLLDDITDIVSGSNGPNVQPVLAFAGACSKITVGKVTHTRPDISGKKALFAGLDNVTDLTYYATRTFRVSTNGAGGFTLFDPWDLVASVTLSVTNIVIQFKSHVTQQAADEAQYRMTSATHANAYRSNSASKTGTVFVVTFAGAAANPQTATFTVEGILTK